jgi:hypothetical protein
MLLLSVSSILRVVLSDIEEWASVDMRVYSVL